MATSQIGSEYVIVDEGYRADPVSGAVSFERTFEGTESSIVALTATLIAEGARVSRRFASGQNVLVGQWNRDPDGSTSDEIPADIWDDDTQTEEIDIFDTDAAVAEAAQYSSVAGYRNVIVEAVNEGAVFPIAAGQSGWPVAYEIYGYLARGVKAIPLNRPVITRNRTFSSTYTPRNRMEYVQKVWTTAKLIALENIPTAVSARFPVDPSPLSTATTVWGWKLTVDRSSYNTATGKIQEVKSWVFGNAIRAFYTIVE